MGADSWESGSSSSVAGILGRGSLGSKEVGAGSSCRVTLLAFVVGQLVVVGCRLGGDCRTDSGQGSDSDGESDGKALSRTANTTPDSTYFHHPSPPSP